MWEEIRRINEVEIDECVIEGLCELIPLTNMSYEELEDKFNVLDGYEITPAHIRHQRMALYFIRYEINKLTGQANKKRN